MRTPDVLVALLVSGVAPAWAQPAHSAHGQEASQPVSQEARTQAEPPRIPTTLYRSAFENYRPFKADELLVDWRGANDKVRDIGGHVGLMKGAADAGVSGRGGHGAGHGGKETRK